MSIRLRLDLDSEIDQVIVQGLRQRPSSSSTGPKAWDSVQSLMLAYYRYDLRINQVIKEHQKEILAGVCIGGFPQCRSEREYQPGPGKSMSEKQDGPVSSRLRTLKKRPHLPKKEQELRTE